MPDIKPLSNTEKMYTLYTQYLTKKHTNKMDLSFKRIIEHPSYREATHVINVEINSIRMELNRDEFRKTKEEKEKQWKLTHEWREQIRSQGYTKRNVPSGVNGYIND